MSSSPPVRERGRVPVEVYFVALVGFLVSSGFGILAPSLPALGHEFHVGATAMSVTVSGFAAARLIANLGFARYLKRFPLRSVLGFGLLVQALLSVVAAFAPDYTTFIVLRSISGVGSAAFTIASTAFILVLVPPEARGKGMAIYAGAMGVGAVSGPVLGGMLVGFGARVPIGVYGFALLLAAITTFVALRRAKALRTHEERSERSPGLRGVGEMLREFARDRLIVAALMCQVVSGWIFYGVRNANIPLQLDVLGYSTAMVGILLAIASITQIAGSSFAGPLSDRSGRRFPMMIGLAIGVVAVGGLVFAEATWVAVGTHVLIGIAGGMLMAVAPTILGDSPRGTNSIAIASFWIVSDVAAIIGPIATGAITESLDFDLAVIVAVALLLIAAVAVWRIGPPRLRTSPQPEAGGPPGAAPPAVS